MLTPVLLALQAGTHPWRFLDRMDALQLDGGGERLKREGAGQAKLNCTRKATGGGQRGRASPDLPGPTSEVTPSCPHPPSTHAWPPTAVGVLPGQQAAAVRLQGGDAIAAADRADETAAREHEAAQA